MISDLAMMKNIKTKVCGKLLTYAVMVFCSVLLCACGGDDDDTPAKRPAEEHELVLSESVIDISHERTTLTVDITTADAWKVTTDGQWIVVRPTEGEGNATLSITCYENTDVKSRQAQLLVTDIHTNQQRSVTIRQKGREAVVANYVSHRAVYGNLLRSDEAPSLEITFDNPVTLKSASYEFYMPDWNPTYSDDRCTVHIPFPAGAIGLDVKGTFQVESADGKTTSLELTFPFYERGYHVGSRDEGEHILGTLVDDDEQTLWLSRCRPSQVLQLSLVDGTVMKTVDMPFTPGHITKNPYNGMLYVMPSNTTADLGFSDQLCVINPQSGAITKTITISPAPDAHPQHPTIYPRELAFMADGLGILHLVSKSSDGFEWRYMDSANGDALTLSGYPWYEYRFEHVYEGCNHQSVWANPYPRAYNVISQMSRSHPAPLDYELDSSFRDTGYEYAGGSMVTMQFHRSRNKVFISTAPACQVVINMDDDTYTKTTPAESRGAASAWDYSDPDRNLVYLVGGLDKKFILLDMDRSDAVYFQYCSWGADEICGLYHLVKTNRVLVIDTMGSICLVACD